MSARVSIWPNWVPVVVEDGKMDTASLPLMEGEVVVTVLNPGPRVLSAIYSSGVFLARNGSALDAIAWVELPDPAQ